MQFSQPEIPRFLKRPNGHLARDRREPIEELPSACPPSRRSIKFMNGTRVPRKHGVPFMTSGSLTITDSTIHPLYDLRFDGDPLRAGCGQRLIDVTPATGARYYP